MLPLQQGHDMLTRSEYFDGRAAASREMRDAATDVSVAYAHGQLANRYQFAATTAHAAEQLGENAAHGPHVDYDTSVTAIP